MLLLTRRVGEAIHIGDDIIVRVSSVNGTQVRIGVEAPDDMDILRDEIKYPEIKVQRFKEYCRRKEYRERNQRY